MEHLKGFCAENDFKISKLLKSQSNRRHFWCSTQIQHNRCDETSQTDLRFVKKLHDRRFQGKKFTQKTRNFRHLLNRDKKCINALNWDKTSKKCSVTM